MLVSVLVLAGFSAASLSLSALGTGIGVALAQTVPTMVAPVPVSDNVAANSSLAAFETAFERIYTQVTPSVVNIQVVEQAPVPAARSRNGGNLPGGQLPAVPQQALGSGFVWDKQGDIVTNNHVVNGASSTSVTFADGTAVEAKVVGSDPNADLAVIKVNVPADQLLPVQVGGDVITGINGQPVNRFDDLTSYLLSQTAPGQTVTLTILRGGQAQTIKVTLGTIPTN